MEYNIKKRQWTRGLPLSFIGLFVYAFLRAIGKKRKDFYGIPYLEIKMSGRGFSMGWFFVCSEDASEQLKAHEVGHSIQNARTGGLKILALTFCSISRFWIRKIVKPKSGYYDWWFEAEASRLGESYVKEREKQDVADS